jgi:hypothetical protein
MHKFILDKPVPKFIESEYKNKFLDLKEGEAVPSFIDLGYSQEVP